jgi:5-methylcytosine-specific restriction enzyme subunit McrC
MTPRDLRLAERLRRLPRDANLDVRPGNDGVAIQATGAVGVVRFTGFEVRVSSKLPGDHLGLFELVEFAGGVDDLVRVAGAPRLRHRGDSLLDFVIEVLVLETERLVTRGLRADYVERELDLAAVRGRLLVDRQYLERLGLFDRVVCRYDEHEHDVPDNQLLAVALARAAHVATVPRLRRRARALAAFLEDVCDPAALELEEARRTLEYTRHNEHYRPAHALCWMLLDNLGPDEDLQPGRTGLRSFLIDMSALFERFVERLLRCAIGSAGNVAAQRSASIFWRPDIAKRYAHVRPDLLVHPVGDARRRLPIDAKYKRYDGGSVAVDDLTQAFLYAYAYRAPTDTTPPRAVLVHPSETIGEPTAVPVQVRSVTERIVDAELTVLGVHIPTCIAHARAGGGNALNAVRAATLAHLSAGVTR